MHSLTVGLGLGFLVALQLGPMSLFLIRSTLRGGWRVGAAIGAGVAVIDALYAACGSAGAAGLLTLEPLRLALGLAGGAVLLALGARTLWSAFRVRLGGEVRDEVVTPRRAFATALAATASNPLTIASWAAVFAAASVGGAAASPALLVSGVGLGSLAEMTLLATGVAAARRALGERAMRIADCVAGLGLMGFGAVLVARAVGEG